MSVKYEFCFEMLFFSLTIEKTAENKISDNSFVLDLFVRIVERVLSIWETMFGAASKRIFWS